MATPHIESKKDDISELVLMPGDPLRAKYIAEKYLDDVKIVNEVRNMTAYTGFYGDKRVTVFPSGMGIPSMGIYAYELFKNYNVKKIIRIGSAGSFNKKVKIRDIILSEGAVTRSCFSELLDNKVVEYSPASNRLNFEIVKKAEDKKVKLNIGKTISSDVFDPYCENQDVFAENFYGLITHKLKLEGLYSQRLAIGPIYIDTKLLKDWCEQETGSAFLGYAYDDNSLSINMLGDELENHKE